MANVDLRPGRLDVYLVQGDALNSSVVTLEFTDSDGDPININTVTFEAQICKGAETIPWNLQTVDAANGIVAPEVDTSEMLGTYSHYITMTSASNDRTYITGRVRVERRGCGNS